MACFFTCRGHGSEGAAQLIVNVNPDDLVERLLGGEAQAQRPRRLEGWGPGLDDAVNRVRRHSRGG